MLMRLLIQPSHKYQRILTVISFFSKKKRVSFRKENYIKSKELIQPRLISIMEIDWIEEPLNDPVDVYGNGDASYGDNFIIPKDIKHN